MFADPIDHAVNSSGEAPRAAGMPITASTIQPASTVQIGAATTDS
jgi:hypothetical protein